MMDGKGVLGMPVRLAVAVVLIAVCVPSLAYAVDTFQTDAKVSDASSEADIILSAADSVYYSGAGSTRTVDVSVPSGCEIIIGGEGQDAYTVRISCKGEIEKTIYTQRPAIRFLGGPVTVSGSAEVHLECTNGAEGYGVKVTLR